MVSEVSTCGSTDIIGGYQILGGDGYNSISTNFSNIPAHWSLQMELNFFQINDWGGNSFIIESEDIDSGNFTILNQMILTNQDLIANICGDPSQFDQNFTISVNTTSHFSENFNILMENSQTSEVLNYWGFQALIISIDTCDTSCATCNGPSNSSCLSCVANFFLSYNFQCVQSCGNNYYPDPATNTCLSCNSYCLSCSGPSNQNCLTCSPLLYLINSQCLSSCPLGFYENTINNTCGICNNLCNQCSGPSALDCTTCSSLRYLYQSQCVLSCPSSTFANSTTNLCDSCNSSCFSCSGPQSSECNSCQTGLFLYLGNCSSSCPQNFYPDSSTNECVPCDFLCKACFGSSSYQCLSCYQKSVSLIYYFYNNQCIKNCPIGFFPNNTNYICQSCSSSCLTCNGYGPTNCQSCPSSSYFYLNECYPGSCPSDTYNSPTTQNCFQCNSACLTCTGPTSNECISCQFSYYQLGSSCYQFCPSGYYENPTNMTCGLCDSSCSNCSGPFPSQCNSCQSGQFLNGSSCVVDCGPGYFGYDNGCEYCNGKCLTCYGGSDSQCYTCTEFLFLENNTCVYSCSPGRYKNFISNTCDICDPSCETCVGSGFSNCSSCQTPNILNISVCALTCDNDQWNDTSTNSCQFCPSSCKTCSSSIVCFSCRTHLYLSGSSCVETCPTGTFPNSADSTCESCDMSCLTCNGPLPSECQSCPGNNYYLQASSCVTSCSVGYYLSGSFCLNCDPTCHTCNGGLSTECLSCIGGRLLYNGACSDSCPTFYQPNFSTNYCDYCFLSCLTCALGLCSCNSNQYSYINQCFSICPIGTYPTTNPKQCLVCSPNCLDCTGSSNSQCSQCIDGYYQEGTSCLATCPDGTYPNNSTFQCSNCDSSCTTCSGPTPNNCISCNEGFYLSIDEECLLSCPFGMFLRTSDNTCQYCLNDCSSCLQNLTCTSCFPGSFLNNGSCYQICQQGTYPLTSNWTCSACNSVCVTCTGPTNISCTSCQPGFYIISGRCVSQCPSDGTFLDIPNNQCVICDNSCNSCSGGASNQCLSCYYGQFLTNDRSCVSICPLQFYENTTTWLCEPCFSNCQTCSSGLNGNCYSCNSPFYFSTYSCNIGCPLGFYLQVNTQNCSTCDTGCSVCSGPNSNECTSCFYNYYLMNNQCLSVCSNGQYGDILTNICMSCDVSCSTCYGPTNSDCFSCVSGYFLENTQCLSFCENYFYAGGSICETCDISCLTCSGPLVSNCLSCDYPYFYYQGYCSYYCPNGTYYNYTLRSCPPCNQACSLCSGPSINQCTACTSGFFLSQYSCIPASFCPNGSFPDNINNLCAGCNGGCSSCASQNICSSCDLNNFFFQNNCVTACPDGYYPDSTTMQCLICDPSCNTCQGATSNDCLSCDVGQYLNGYTCVYVCPAKKYPDSVTNGCHICNPLCHNCTGPSSLECLTCSYPRFFTQNICALTCPKNEYGDWLSQQCLPCDISCLSCSGNGPNKCTSCYIGYFLFNKTCLSNCPSGYYENNAQNICSTCSTQCFDCTGPTNTECSQCALPYYFSNNSCIMCNTSSYFNNATNSCLSCDFSCQTCIDSTTKCLSCLIGSYLLNNSCFNECPIGYYANSTVSICSLCPADCKTCDVGQCLSCYSNNFYYNYQCLQNCPSGFYPDNIQNICISCTDKVDNCTLCNSTNCIRCQTPYYLLNNSCYLACPSTTYPINTTMTCESCFSSCSKCLNGDYNQCYECTSSFYLLESQSTCVQNCPQTTYIVSNPFQKCVNCIIPCELCNQTQGDFCFSCVEGYYLFGNQCIQNCEAFNLYSYEPTRTCLKCDSSCLTCSGESPYDCLTCQLGLFLYINQPNLLSECLSQCPNNTYPFNGICIEKIRVSYNITEVSNPRYFICNITGYTDSVNLSNSVIVQITGLNNTDYDYSFVSLDDKNLSFGILLTYNTQLFHNKLQVSFNFPTNNPYISFDNTVLTEDLENYQVCPETQFFNTTAQICQNKHDVFFSLDYTSDSTVFSLKFEEEIDCLFNFLQEFSSLTIDNFKRGIDFDYTINETTNFMNFEIILNNYNKILNMPTMTYSLKIPDQIVVLNNLNILITEQSLQLYDSYTLSNDQKQLLNSTINALSDKDISNNLLGLTNSYLGSSFFALRGIMLIELIYLLKYVNLNYPENLRVVFYEKSSINHYIFKKMHQESLKNNAPLPKIWIYYDISPYFMNNLGEILCRIVLFWSGGFLLMIFTEKTDKFKAFVNFLSEIFLWFMPLFIFFGYFQEISFKIFLTFKYNHYFDYETQVENGYLSALSFILAIFLFFLFHNAVKQCSIIKPPSSPNKNTIIWSKTDQKNQIHPCNESQTLFESLKTLSLTTKQAICKPSNFKSKKTRENEFNIPPTKDIMSSERDITEDNHNNNGNALKLNDLLVEIEENRDLDKENFTLSNKNLITESRKESYKRNQVILGGDFKEKEEDYTSSNSLKKIYNLEIGQEDKCEKRDNEIQESDKQDGLDGITENQSPNTGESPLKSTIFKKLEIKIPFSTTNNRSFKRKSNFMKETPLFSASKIVSIKYSKARPLILCLNCFFVPFITWNKVQDHEKYLKKYLFLHEDCKNKGFLIKNFILLDLYRQTLMSFTVALFYSAPFFQIVILTIIHFSYLTLIIILRPLTTKIGIYMTILNELTSGMAMVSALTIGIYDKIGGDNGDQKFFLGWLIIFANVGLLYSLIVFTILKIAYSTYEHFKKKSKDIHENIRRFSNFLQKMANKNVIVPEHNVESEKMEIKKTEDEKP